MDVFNVPVAEERKNNGEDVSCSRTTQKGHESSSVKEGRKEGKSPFTPGITSATVKIVDGGKVYRSLGMSHRMFPVWRDVGPLLMCVQAEQRVVFTLTCF